MTADGGDYTVHVVVGLDAEGRMYLLDLWRRRAAADECVEAFCDLVLAWRPIGWAEEQGQIRSGVGPFLDKRMRERSAFVARQQFAARGDKAVRAQSMRGRMALEGLYVPAGSPWLADFRAELLSFPVGRHNDQVAKCRCRALRRATVTIRPSSRRPLRSLLPRAGIGSCSLGSRRLLLTFTDGR